MDKHRQLRIWQLGRQLVKAVYSLTSALPNEERYVVIAQLRRAAWSVPNNIAEGNAKLGPGELRKYLDCAIGSLAEIDTMATILPDLYRIDPPLLTTVDQLRRDTARGIYALIRRRGR
ncbi:MAG: four helix bundle protein [Gemmatimonadetes bacterium]|nr:four helix bundle protein [Gemmatimonadota bacterium]